MQRQQSNTDQLNPIQHCKKGLGQRCALTPGWPVCGRLSVSQRDQSSISDSQHHHQPHETQAEYRATTQATFNIGDTVRPRSNDLDLNSCPVVANERWENGTDSLQKIIDIGDGRLTSAVNCRRHEYSSLTVRVRLVLRQLQPAVVKNICERIQTCSPKRIQERIAQHDVHHIVLKLHVGTFQWCGAAPRIGGVFAAQGAVQILQRRILFQTRRS
mmetsp:Transcript_26319/g.56023  ORF Transcript_26319/g.56023 Transcript_26319/m.56023 type:complete len:215 (-) Transcript_26319:232-876(-)